jgi:YD repeat-containing protein
MVRLRTAFLVLVLIGVVPLPAAWLGTTRSAFAGHFPWDQGHDTFVVVLVEIGMTPGPGGLCKRASPLEAATGNFIYTTQDLLIPALGPDIEVTRTYNSRDMRHGSFGHGWVFTYDVRLVETTNGDLFFAICGQGDGRRERFIRKADGTFKPPAHLFSTLVKNANGTFTLREKDGTTYRFDVDGRLTAAEDRNGNTMKFTYDATGFLTRLRDASGRTLIFSKGANGKIDSITDPAGRVLRYLLPMP